MQMVFSIQQQQADVQVIMGQDDANFLGNCVDHRLEVQLTREGPGDAEKVMEHILGMNAGSFHGHAPIIFVALPYPLSMMAGIPLRGRSGDLIEEWRMLAGKLRDPAYLMRCSAAYLH